MPNGMLIFDNEPKDWIDLQAMVGRLFREMGREFSLTPTGTKTARHVAATPTCPKLRSTTSCSSG
jgi:hypothetical protein